MGPELMPNPSSPVVRSGSLFEISANRRCSPPKKWPVETTSMVTSAFPLPANLIRALPSADPVPGSKGRGRLVHVSSIRVGDGHPLNDPSGSLAESVAVTIDLTQHLIQQYR